jgi:dienelactone hydrolase
MRLPSSFVIQRVSIFPLLSMVLPVVLAANWCTSRVYASHPVRSQVQIEEPLEEAGTYSIKITKGTRITNSGTMQPYTIYAPESKEAHGPFPAVILIHGFLMTGEQHRNNAEYMAKHGFIVLTPDISKWLWGDDKRTRNVDDLLDDLAWLTGKKGDQPESIRGRVDSTRIGVAGNSSGGAAALELALRAQKEHMPVRALVSLDGVPWDRTLEHLHELSPIKLLTLRAEPCLCNYHARMLKFLSKLSFSYEDVKVNGARHCDVENPTTLGCFSICGKSDGEHRVVFQNLLYLYFRDQLSAPKVGKAEKTFDSYISELQSEKKVVKEMSHPEQHKDVVGALAP